MLPICLAVLIKTVYTGLGVRVSAVVLARSKVIVLVRGNSQMFLCPCE
jgi:hypothetical protein